MDKKLFPSLIAGLADTPETTIWLHALTKGMATAWVSGYPANFVAAIVRWPFAPEHLAAFGTDASALWDMVRMVRGWAQISLPQALAPAVGVLIGRETGRRVRSYGDLYFTLIDPATSIEHPAVRQLSLPDLCLLHAAPKELRGPGWTSPEELMREGVAAGAVVDGRLVAMVHTAARTRRHADLSAHTLPEWRARGFATAAAWIVAQCVQGAGQIPVWTTEEDNWASLRVARKLGFAEVSRRIILALEPSVLTHGGLYEDGND